MAVYRRILIAVDLLEDTAFIARRGRTLAQALDSDVRLIHVIPPMPVVTQIPPEPVVPAIVQTEAELIEAARERMSQLTAELGVPTTHSEVVVGDVRGEIARAARSGEADLIVIGSHEHHGRSLLAHFTTEDRLLHRAPCDVLAVRVP